MKAQQNNLQALKQRISEQSTNPDSQEVITNSDAIASRQKERYKIQKRDLKSLQQNPYQNHLMTPQPGAQKVNSLMARDQRPGNNLVNLTNMSKMQSQAAILMNQ